ncbi:unnamed protein product [Brugia timori]|uniref:Ovule protein n=1 Tax=Brugia timori TaxID=42155 RepID=A0A0R3R8I6_9BILA|nr:unnamed protein product [Brugia timori]
MTTLPQKEKKSRQKSPRPKSKSPKPETFQVDNENTNKDRMMSCTSSNKADHTSAAKASEVRKIPKDSSIKVDEIGAQECRNETPKSTTITKTEETKINQITKHSLGAKEKNLELESNLISESELEKSTASIARNEKKHPTKSREAIKKKKKEEQKSKSSKLRDLKSELEGKEVKFSIP